MPTPRAVCAPKRESHLPPVLSREQMNQLLTTLQGAPGAGSS